MNRPRMTPQARVDLLEIWHFIAKDSIERANGVWQDLKAGMIRISEFPGLGHTRADVKDKQLRFWAVHSYLIVYRPEPRPVRIIRVVSGRRDIKRLLG